MPISQLPQTEVEGYTRRRFLGFVFKAAVASTVVGPASIILGTQPTGEFQGPSTDEMLHDHSVQPTTESISTPPSVASVEYAPLNKVEKPTLIRKKFVPISTKEYWNDAATKKVEPLFFIGDNIKILSDGERPGATPDSIFVLQRDLNGVPNPVGIFFETEDMPGKNTVKEWKSVFSVFEHPDRVNAQEYVAQVLGELMCVVKDGQPSLYDPKIHGPMHDSGSLSVSEISIMVREGSLSLGVDIDNLDNKFSQFSVNIEVIKKLIGRSAEDVDKTMADKLCALMAYKKEILVGQIAQAKTKYFPAAASIISEAANGTVSKDEALTKMNSLPLKIIDDISGLSINPKSQLYVESMGGYYHSPEVGEGEHVAIVMRPDILYQTERDIDANVVSALLHEVAGHAMAGLSAVKYRDRVFQRMRGGAQNVFVDQGRKGGSGMELHDYGTWFVEAMAELAASESIVLDHNSTFFKFIYDKAEVNLLLSLITGMDSKVANYPIELTYEIFDKKRDSIGTKATLAAFRGYNYTSRSTDGPKGFSSAEYPWDDEAVKARKNMVKVVDGHYGPGFFNRVNLAVAKAEYYDQDTDGGHASLNSISYSVSSLIGRALYHDVNNIGVEFGLDKSSNFSLPWLGQKPVPEKGSAIDSDTYKEFKQKFPAVYDVMALILGAKSEKDLIETLGKIRSKIAIPLKG